jgi:hypothetical protein
VIVGELEGWKLDQIAGRDPEFVDTKSEKLTFVLCYRLIADVCRYEPDESDGGRERAIALHEAPSRWRAADDTTTVNKVGVERSEDVDIMGQSGAQLDLTEGSTGLLPKGGGTREGSSLSHASSSFTLGSPTTEA